MRKFLKKMSRKVARPPGTLIHMGEKKTEAVTLDMIRYNKDILEEQEMESSCQCTADKNFNGVCWINVTGVHNVSTIRNIGANFGLHPLVLEDILNTYQRPKYEDLDDYIFVILKMLSYDTDEKEVKAEHVGFVLGSNFVITFQERKGDVFDSIRQRIRSSKGRIRKNDADYLLYALVDAVVDHYYLVLEALGEEIVAMEDRLLIHPDPEALQVIHKLKRETLFLKRAVWPLREVINSMLKLESGLIKDSTGIFLRDIYDHIIQAIETAETYRDMVAGLQELYLSSVSNKMNEIMKVLTIIATLFIPLTFIAGIYGMNFEFMPELKWKFGYFTVWIIMLIAALGMFIYFRRKKWM